MELESLSTSKLLDMASQINAMQKGFCDFCTCMFSVIDDLDNADSAITGKFGLEKTEDQKLAIKLAFTSLSRRYRLKMRDDVKKLTGIELEMTDSDSIYSSIYDSVMMTGMSDIVEKIVMTVREKR